MKDKIKGLYFPVLDNGFVSLVDYIGGDEMIERAARISYGPQTRRVSQTRGLIRYLMRHEHWTPFEMVDVILHVSAPMFIARQWLRHRTGSTNELSGRYSVLPTLFYTPTHDDFALQSQTNKQGRSGRVEKKLYTQAVSRWHTNRVTTVDTYRALLDEGIARELARIDLPLSTYTQFYFKIDLRNLFNFLKLRLATDAQYEIRAYAEVIAGMVQEIAPLAYEAWQDYHLLGQSFTRYDLQALQAMLAGEEADTDGMSPREVGEFREKLTPKPAPDFTLDISKGVTAEEMSKIQYVAQIAHSE